MSVTAFRYARRVAGVGVAGVAGGAAYLYNRDEGFRRACQFAFQALPIALDYRRCELLDNRSESFEKLHDKYADRALEIALSMRGYYIKLAQAVHTMPPCPMQYAKRFSVLIDNAPFEDFETVIKPILEHELGVTSIDDVFQDVSRKPLGAASIGQVHSAVLKDSGLPVVIKVQYPDAEHNFSIDMNLFVYTAKIIAPGFVTILENLQQNFSNEFDYINEATLQKHAYMSMKDFSSQDVIVPRPFLNDHPDLPIAFRGDGLVAGHPRDGLCTKHVMVMDKLEGQSVSRWGDKQLVKMAKMHSFANVHDLKTSLRSLSTEEIIDKFGSPPSRAAVGMYLKLTLARDTAWNYCVAAPANCIFRLACLQMRLPCADPAKRLNQMPDIYNIYDLMYRAEGHLLFHHGLANGDTHAGNIMLLDDGRGIGLIDWGQLRCLSSEKRLQFARLVCAVAARDEVATAKFFHDIGFKTKTNNAWIANKVANFTAGCMSDNYVVGELGGGAKFEENIERLDPIVAWGDADVFIALRMCILLSLTARTLGIMLSNSSDQFRPYAEHLLHQSRDLALCEIQAGRKLPPEAKPDLSSIKF